YPNEGVRLNKEDEHIAVWEEVFDPGKPAPPHRHMRDYIASYPNGGEVTIVPLAGEPEEFTTLAGECKEFPREKGAIRLVFSVGVMVYGWVLGEGMGHFAGNEGQVPTLMILTEIKGTATEKRGK